MYCCGLLSTTDHFPTHSSWAPNPQQTLLRSNHSSNVKGFLSMGLQSPKKPYWGLSLPRDLYRSCHRLGLFQTSAQLQRKDHVLESPRQSCQLNCSCHVSFPRCDHHQLKPRSLDRSNPSVS